MTQTILPFMKSPETVAVVLEAKFSKLYFRRKLLNRTLQDFYLRS